ncbi:MAG: restriction endonuclease subunit S [Treponema sp.]|nr:restriction endonuclease subunit S [Treponema sp.]
MKQSGIDWIGEIPDDWKIIRLKHIFQIKKDIAGKEGFTVLSVTQTGIRPKDMSSKGQFALDYSKYQLVNSGEFIMNHMDLKTGWIDISKYNGVTSPDYRVFYLTDKNCVKDYYKQIFQYCYKNLIFFSLGQGVADLGRWRLPAEMFNNFKLPLPPKATQQRIAEYLDKKVSEIDSIIEESKKSIEEYKAWKQSVIFEAVTGKNLNCKKKDSGIEWIGEIPEGWEVKRLKFASRNRIQKYTSDYGILNYFALENIESQSGRFIETENEYDISQSLICQKNDVVFGKLRPYLAKVYKVNELCCCSGEFAVFYDFEGCPSFFKYYFLSDGFIKIVDSSTYGTKMPRANIDFIKNMLVAIPPLYEQESIAKMLDSKCAQIDSLIAEKESLIADLTEYKKSLIFEVVTGKRSV